MDKAYDFKKVEDKIYKKWEEKGYFSPDINKEGKSFSISLPPPNVTGVLHIGHAFEDTLQDIVTRYHRMKGESALWLPGTDHAAIATQAKFEKDLFKKAKKTRHEFSREEFFSMIQKFALSNQSTILNQLKKLGLSLDWDRLAFTLDKKRELAVRTAFKKMYDAKLIYRGERIVNWDPSAQTTVADDEIEYIEQKDPFYYLQYGPFVIGTVRPETKFGDKYIVVNPEDKRYAKYRHKEKIELEWINGPIIATVIKDHAVDKDMGTGAMTITPSHSEIDFEIAQRHNLDIEQIIDDRGILLPIAGEFVGQHIKKARPLIVEKLKKKKILVKTDEKYIHNVATNYRGGGLIEPQIKKQWFIDVNKKFIIPHSSITGIKSGSETTLKEIMLKAVKSGDVKILPKRFEKTYFHWIENLRDWCISRQIIYGHRIPVWYKKSKNQEKIFVDIEEPEGKEWKQDPDTLDTWFSSGLWTFSTLGWPEKTGDLKKFHPTSVMMPGYEILFFWVARMVLMSGFLLGDIPFKEVYLHGMVRDKHGRKFSKSLNNGVDPLEMIDKYGADALRFTLVFDAALGNDVMFDEQKVLGMKRFANKLWNMARFIEFARKDLNESKSRPESQLQTEEWSQGWSKKTKKKAEEISNYLDKYNFKFAAEKLYHFIWHDFADFYIEGLKVRLTKLSLKDMEDNFLVVLKLLHPFMPFVTEEIFKKLNYKGESLMISLWPVK